MADPPGGATTKDRRASLKSDRTSARREILCPVPSPPSSSSTPIPPSCRSLVAAVAIFITRHQRHYKVRRLVSSSPTDKHSPSRLDRRLSAWSRRAGLWTLRKGHRYGRQLHETRSRSLGRAQALVGSGEVQRAIITSGEHRLDELKRARGHRAESLVGIWDDEKVM